LSHQNSQQKDGITRIQFDDEDDDNVQEEKQELIKKNGKRDTQVLDESSD